MIPLELSTSTRPSLVNAVSADDEAVEAVNLRSLQRRLLRRVDHYSHRQWGVQDDDSVIDSPETIMTHGRRLQQDTAASNCSLGALKRLSGVWQAAIADFRVQLYAKKVEVSVAANVSSSIRSYAKTARKLQLCRRQALDVPAPSHGDASRDEEVAAAEETLADGVITTAALAALDAIP